MITGPTIATANSVGDISNPGTNVVNYQLGADWNGRNGNLTTVGSAGPLSESFYGTCDQGGNVAEWNETPLDNGEFRGRRGGSFGSGELELQSLIGGGAVPAIDANFLGGTGFRVATIPEPATLVLAAMACMFGLVMAVRHRRWHKIAFSPGR